MIRLSKSCISTQEREAVSVVLAKEYLGMGEEVGLFESELCEYLEASSVVCVNTGTSALHLALEACNISVGDEVLVPSLTYVASYQAISASGATPISCDVNFDSATISIEDIKRKITPRSKAIMPVHYAGRVGDLEEIYQIAKEYELRVIEDAAHSFGGLYQSKKIGSFGDIICFSFDGIKNITAGEGGCIVSKDKKIIDYVKDARLLGVQKDSEKRYAHTRSWQFDVVHQGYRYHMSNIMAAIGRVQLKKLDKDFAPKRRALALLYNEYFKGIKEIIYFEDDYLETLPHIYPIRWMGGGGKNSFCKFLSQQGIQTGFHYYPNHLLSRWNQNISLPNVEKLNEELVSLPLHPDLRSTDIEQIVSCIKKYILQRSQ